MAEEKSKKETEKTEKDKRHGKPPISEWIVAAVGCVLVAGAIGFMVYEAATQENLPPNFIFKINSTTQSANGYLVKFELENTGDETAGDVAVEGTLSRGEENIEQSSVTLDYAPSHSKREGGLFFTKNPNEFELKIRVTGYEKP